MYTYTHTCFRMWLASTERGEKEIRKPTLTEHRPRARFGPSASSKLSHCKVGHQSTEVKPSLQSHTDNEAMGPALDQIPSCFFSRSLLPCSKRMLMSTDQSIQSKSVPHIPTDRASRAPPRTLSTPMMPNPVVHENH